MSEDTCNKEELWSDHGERFVKLVILVFLMAGLPAGVSGKDLGKHMAAVVEVAVKAKSEAQKDRYGARVHQ